MSATTQPDSPAPFSSVTARILALAALCFALDAIGVGFLVGAAHAQTLAAPVAAAGTNANPLLMLLAMIPQPYAGYVMSAFSIATTVITAASAIVALLPPPTTTSGAWYWVFTVVNKLAINFGHARSLSAPESAGIVGGPGATTAPLIATSVVPLVTATPAEKAVTIVPAVLPPPAPSATPPAADVVAGAAAAAAFEAKKAAACPTPIPVTTVGTIAP